MELHFKGTDTSKVIKYSAYANSFLELYDELVNKKVISVVDYDPYTYACIEKAGFNIEKLKELCKT